MREFRTKRQQAADDTIGTLIGKRITKIDEDGSRIFVETEGGGSIRAGMFASPLGTLRDPDESWNMELKEAKARDELPYVRSVREVYSYEDQGADHHVGHFIFLALDPMAGHKNRYSVIKVDYESGQAEVLGRELPLDHARKIAKQVYGECGACEAKSQELRVCKETKRRICKQCWDEEHAKVCAACGRKVSKVKHAIHRDGFGVGPQVPLCNACGAHETPTCEQIWSRIYERRSKKKDEKQ